MWALFAIFCLMISVVRASYSVGFVEPVGDISISYYNEVGYQSTLYTCVSPLVDVATARTCTCIVSAYNNRIESDASSYYIRFTLPYPAATAVLYVTPNSGNMTLQIARLSPTGGWHDSVSNTDTRSCNDACAPACVGYASGTSAISFPVTAPGLMPINVTSLLPPNMGLNTTFVLKISAPESYTGDAGVGYCKCGGVPSVEFRTKSYAPNTTYPKFSFIF
eukprot:Phypoly_transcript_10409.p1 GENE.Phypoly_transcript_10409~~Phypoly_transcript_10409.p1  ORF type:complete len:221 (+),score=8.75 Phypoly_transcript_10409:163-825(+)